MRVLGTVLVVDDDPLVLASVAAALEAVGFQVWATDSGEDAIALVDRVHPDTVVTDLRMPGMDGLSLLDRLAHCPGRAPETTIIYSAAPPAPSVAAREVRWVPKASGHKALIDALTEGRPRSPHGP